MQNGFERPPHHVIDPEPKWHEKAGGRAPYWLFGVLIALALIFAMSYGMGPNTTTTAYNEPVNEKVVQPAPTQPAKPATEPAGQ